MAYPGVQLCHDCAETQEKLRIDIAALLNRMAQIKGELSYVRKKDVSTQEFEAKSLSDRERIYLCLWLCGYSAYTIAFRYQNRKYPTMQDLSKKEEGIQRLANNMMRDMSNTVYFYIKHLIGLKDQTCKLDSALVVNFLRENGFRKENAFEPDQKVEKATFFLMVQVKDPTILEDIVKTLKRKNNVDFVTVLQSVRVD